MQKTVPIHSGLQLMRIVEKAIPFESKRTAGLQLLNTHLIKQV